MSFPPPSFSNIRIISKRLFFYHKNGCTPTLRMITRLQRYIKNPELPSNSGDFCDLFATKQQWAFVSFSTMTYCVVQITCLPLPRFLKGNKTFATWWQPCKVFVCLVICDFFREVASFFKKKSYLCTEMSDTHEYWTSIGWRCLQSKGILSR